MARERTVLARLGVLSLPLLIGATCLAYMFAANRLQTFCLCVNGAPVIIIKFIAAITPAYTRVLYEAVNGFVFVAKDAYFWQHDNTVSRGATQYALDAFRVQNSFCRYR